jgi:hypothetical protein
MHTPYLFKVFLVYKIKERYLSGYCSKIYWNSLYRIGYLIRKDMVFGFVGRILDRLG